MVKQRLKITSQKPAFCYISGIVRLIEWWPRFRWYKTAGKTGIQNISFTGFNPFCTRIFTILLSLSFYHKLVGWCMGNPITTAISLNHQPVGCKKYICADKHTYGIIYIMSNLLLILAFLSDRVRLWLVLLKQFSYRRFDKVLKLLPYEVN